MATFWVPPRVERPELIDSEEPSEADFAASFSDVARVNRFLGGTSAIREALPPLLSIVPANRPVRVLDIATGSADIPRSLVLAARRDRLAGRALRITATDNHCKVLAFAHRQTPKDRFPEITIEPANAFALPYPDNAFDIALCSMAFHHFGPQACVSVLREMERVTTVGWVVNDLLRHRLACGLIWALTRLVGANRLTRHDAPLSVLRAYTVGEYAQMTRDAGIPHCTVRRVPLFRAVIVRNKTTHSF